MRKIAQNKHNYLPILLVGILLVAVAVGYPLWKRSTIHTANNYQVVSSCKPEATQVSREQAVTAIRTLPEVKQYLKRLQEKDMKPVIEVDNPDDKKGSLWSIHVYENVLDSETTHTATFNWYSVDKCSGAVRCSFNKFDTTGNLVGISSESEYPCN